MKKDGFKGELISVVGIFVFWTLCILTGVLYFLTSYFLYFFLAVTSLFLASTNTLFLLLQQIDLWSKEPEIPKVKKRKIKKAKKKEKEESEEQLEEFKETEEEPAKKKISINFYKIATVLSYALYVVIFYYCCTSSWSYLKKMKSVEGIEALHGVLALLLFVILIVVDRVCKYAENENDFSKAVNENTRIFTKLLCFQTLLSVAYVIYSSFKLVNIQTYVAYAYVASFYYFVVFITLSLVVVAIRKEFCKCPYLSVPLPMIRRKGIEGRPGFIDYLETNTGISMRSLWSVKYVKQIAPMIVFISGVFLWLSTCVVQVDSYQQAAVYRIGALQEKMLQPGIHLVLPYPLDKVEIYDTETIQKITIGYRSEESGDNIWTGNHGNSEHKLLLGSGDEVVSINLRLEYKISDLKKYLETTAQPVSHMEAMAYELVTDQTIASDLNTMLSTDRDVFAANFQKELSKQLEARGLGLEVVCVVLESIHPPVEIAEVYQKLISAEIEAQKYLYYAEGNAAAKVAYAEQTANSAVGKAQVENEQKKAQATSEATVFSASVNANKTYGSAYTYYKRLAAIRASYQKANLVILGDGIQESMLYFGSIVNE